jgi:DNA-binding MarR family transcriptional regulator
LRQHYSASALELSERIGADYVSVVDTLNQLIKAGLVVWQMGPHGFAYQLKGAKPPHDES